VGMAAIKCSTVTFMLYRLQTCVSSELDCSN
jgi:hypothetical protein